MFQTYEPKSDKSFAAKNLPPLREEMAKMGIDALVVPHDDEYLNEYLPDCAERLMWVSGFSGSAGAAIILAKSAAVFTDGRYTLQVREQVDEKFFTYEDLIDNPPHKWIEKNARKGMVIGYDPMLHSKSGVMALDKAAKAAGASLKKLEKNPIDLAWAGRPPMPTTPITPHGKEFAGESAAQKRSRIVKVLQSQNADAVLLTAPHSLAWLFNIRGRDVHATPLPLGRAILYTDGKAELYVDPAKITDGLAEHLGADVKIRPESDVASTLDTLGKQGKTVMIDPGLAPYWFYDRLKNAGAKLIEAPDPCALPRATKNPVELDGTRTAHRRDGVAVTHFLHWISEEAPKGGVTEISAAQKLEEFRKRSNQLQDISFDSISAVDDHGAQPHYRVTVDSDKPLKPGSLYLIDSGGQYPDGTTDITRTIAIGTPSDEMRNRYTLVLKGHIALATARFPHGTTGHALDCLARKPLWEAGLDYDHGTGHGVGVFLGVHEGPQNISKKAITQPLLPGMICSNEPGFYKEGEFGIRIENLVVVTRPEPIPGGEREMMGFETITLAPLDRNLIDKNLLTEAEIQWVNDYHQRVRDALADELEADTRAWMHAMTAAL